MTIMTTVTISDLKAIFNVPPCRNGAVHLLPRALLLSATEMGSRVMAFQTDKLKTAPTSEAAGATDPYQTVARDRRVDRTEDLNEEGIAAVEASEIEPGFEYLDAELAAVVEVGVDFAENFGRVAMSARDGRPTRRFATASLTSPDRNSRPPADRRSQNRPEGQGTCVFRKGQSASAWRALRSIWCPDDTMSGPLDSQNR